MVDFSNRLASCIAYQLGTVNKESDLVSLFHVFESTTFGFSMIHDEADRIFGKITVRDLLNLFQDGLLSSDLRVQDVASGPVFAMSKGARVIDCLHEMESRKYRKVKIAGTTSVVSDILIFSQVFDEKRLQRISKTPQHLLDDTLEDLQTAQGTWISGNKGISEAAKIIGEIRAGLSARGRRNRDALGLNNQTLENGQSSNIKQESNY